MLHSLATSIWIMFISSFIIQYFFMSWFMADSLPNITNSIGKFYVSVVMGLFMVLIEIFMFQMGKKNINLFSYLPFVFLLVLFIYLYRIQAFIGDKEYLNEMIEHHSMAVLTSRQILEKTTTQSVAHLAKRILHTQTKEIQEMKDLVLRDL